MARLQPRHPDAPTYVDFPFQVDWHGRAATTDTLGHVRDLLEQILFTAPGERVNRPGFGSGIEHAVFRPTHELVLQTARATTEAAIQQWLGHLIQLVSLEVGAEENVLTVDVVFSLRHEHEPRTMRFERTL